MGRVVSGWIVLALVVPLIAGTAGALEPAWTAPGGPPVSISADGGYVLSDGEIFTLYSAKGERIWRGFGGSAARAREGEIFSPLEISRDGLYSILGTVGGLLYVDRSQRVFWQDSQYLPVDDLSLSPDGNFIASVADGRVSVYSRGGDLLWRNGTSTYSGVRYVGISSAGLLTVARAPGVLYAFNQTGFELWNYSAPGIGEIILSPENSDIIVVSDYTLLALHPSGNLLWSFYTGSGIRDIAVSRDGSSIAAGNLEGRVFLVDGGGNQLWVYPAGSWIDAVSVSGNGSLVAAGGTDRKVYLFDREGRQVGNYTTGGMVRSVAVSADGSGLAAAADQVYYFDLRRTIPAETMPPASPPATPEPVTTAQISRPPSPSPPVEPVSPSPVVPPETTRRESASGPLSFFALGIGFLWFVLRRAG
jgi:WD40 repeat protein